MSKPIPFVLSDETVVNTYGFRIKHAGLSIERFKKNPVMLDGHWNSNTAVLGNWSNPRFEGTELKAESNFDLADKDVKKIAGKVERGFIKGCSVGIIFDPVHLKLAADGVLELEKSEVLEASICPVPSNGNAISLFDTKGQLLSESEVKQLCLSVQPQQPEFKNNNEEKMSKIALTAAALVALHHVGLSTAEDEATISKGIIDLKSQLDTANANLSAEKTARQALQTQMDEQKKVQATALIDKAIEKGQLKADVKDQFVQMAMDNYTLAATVIAAMPEKTNLSGTINNTPVPAGTSTDPKTLDEFEKLTTEKQLAFKTTNPAAYNALFA